jgi:uncharacterized protein YdbL (DUF1318 family)
MNANRIAFLLSLILFFGYEIGFAATPADRIRDRLPEVDALKASGEVGEAADGYLAARESIQPTARDVVEAENRDRRALYSEIAGRTGQSTEEVGRQRALRVFELSRPGVWLKGPDGQWYRK